MTPAVALRPSLRDKTDSNTDTQKQHTNRYCQHIYCRAATQFSDLCFTHQQDFCQWIQRQKCEDLLEVLQKGIKVL